MGLLLAAANATSGHVSILPGWLWRSWRLAAPLDRLAGGTTAIRHKRSEIKCDMLLAELLGKIVGDGLMIDPENKKFTFRNPDKFDKALTEIREVANHERMVVLGDKT